MDTISEKREVKSDFKLHYCSWFRCLADTKYCEFGCAIMHEKKLKNPHLSYDKLSCLWRYNEDMYLDIRQKGLGT